MASSPLFAQASLVARRAVDADKAGRHQAALDDYMTAADLLTKFVQSEGDSRQKDVIRLSIKQYCERAERIRGVLRNHGMLDDSQRREPVPVAVSAPASRYAALWNDATQNLYAAIAADRAGDCDAAVAGYISASQMFLEYLKLRGKSYGSKQRFVLIDKVNDYVSRVEVLRRRQRPPNDQCVDALGFKVDDPNGDAERARIAAITRLSFVGHRAGEQVVAAWAQHVATECGKSKLVLPSYVVELVARFGFESLPPTPSGQEVRRWELWRCLSGACCVQAQAAAEGVTYRSLLALEVEEGCPDVGHPLTPGAPMQEICPQKYLSDEDTVAQMMKDRSFSRPTPAMVERYDSQKLSSLAVIEVDLRRTFVNNTYASTPPFICSLRRVLRAYWRRSSHGYTQAQHTLAGFALLVSHMDEELALWILTVLSEDAAYHDRFYSDDCVGWCEVDMIILKELIFERCPLLNPATNPDLPADWLSQFNLLLHGGLVMQWFFKVFVNLAPTDFVLRVWDVLFAGGGTCVLHKLVLTIFEQHAAEMLNAEDFQAQLLKPAVHVVDHSALFAAVLGAANSGLTPEWLMGRRKEIRDELAAAQTAAAALQKQKELEAAASAITAEGSCDPSVLPASGPAGVVAQEGGEVAIPVNDEVGVAGGESGVST